MSGICGWVGTLSGEEESHRCLAGMLRDCGADSGIEIPGVREPNLHLGCVGRLPEVSERLYADETFAAVLSDPLQSASGRRILARDLVDLYRAHELQFLRRVRGAFALALYDHQRQRLLLARDPTGQRTLYLYRNGAYFAFASRLSAFRRLPGFRPQLDAQALLAYFHFQTVPSPGAIYRDCAQLPPGELLVMENRQAPSQRLFWSPWGELKRTDTEVPETAFSHRFSKALARSLQDVPEVAVLSQDDLGTAVLQHALGRWLGHPPTRLHPGEVAVQSGDPEALEAYLSTLAAVSDEPQGSPLLLSAYLCARAARQQGIGCLISSAGARELFGATALTARAWQLEGYRRIPAFWRETLMEPLLFRLPKLQRWNKLQSLRARVREAQEPLSTWFYQQTAPRWSKGTPFSSEFLAQVDEAALRAALEAGDLSPLDQLMAWEIRFSLVDRQIAALHRAGEFAETAIRYPFLDQDLLRFACHLPPEVRLNGGGLLARLPHESLPEPAVPRQAWLKANLGDWMGRKLTALGKRGFLLPDYLDWLSTQATPDQIERCWSLAMLEHWLEEQAH